MPDWYAEEPLLMPGEQFFMKAYCDLSTCRNSNGDIPWTVANEYGKEMGLEDETISLFRKVVLLMNVIHRKETEGKTLRRKRVAERAHKNTRRRSGFSHSGNSGR